MAVDEGKWDSKRGFTAFYTGGGSELPYGDEANISGRHDEDVDPELPGELLEPATSPVWSPAEGAFDFGGSTGAADFLRNQYEEGIIGAQGRTAPQITAAELDATKQEQFRNQQVALMAALQARSEGRGPMSQAESMALQQGEAGKRAAMAQGISARGLTGSAGLRAAQQQQGMAGIQAQQQRSIIKGQEQRTAQQLLGSLASGLRGTDLEFATTDARIKQETDAANQLAYMEQMGINDKLTQFYLDMGFSLEEAILKATIEKEKITSDIVTAQIEAQTGVIVKDIGGETIEGASDTATAGTVGAGVIETTGGDDDGDTITAGEDYDY